MWIDDGHEIASCIGLGLSSACNFVEEIGSTASDFWFMSIPQQSGCGRGSAS